MLIDGQQALPRIAEALVSARTYVHRRLAHHAEFGLTRDERASRLRDLLAELAEHVDVRVLLWGGSPLPLFSPIAQRLAGRARSLFGDRGCAARSTA